jgi:hypothetical protein
MGLAHCAAYRYAAYAIRSAVGVCEKTGTCPVPSFQDLQHSIRNKWGGVSAVEGPLLCRALEQLTGISGLKRRAVREGRPQGGAELLNPFLEAALEKKTELSIEDWRGVDLSGLKPHHYVSTGGRILMPIIQRNSGGAKWLKTHGVKLDITRMDNLFATFNPGVSGVHYFLVHWSTEDRMVTVCDALADATNENHKLATVLVWAVLLASARSEHGG